MIADMAAAVPVPSHANATSSPRPRPRSHWCGTPARRTVAPATPARAPPARWRPAAPGRTAGCCGAIPRNRPPGGRRRCQSSGAPAAARPARATKECRGRDLLRRRAALAHVRDFASPTSPSHRVHFILLYQSISLFSCYNMSLVELYDHHIRLLEELERIRCKRRNFFFRNRHARPDRVRAARCRTVLSGRRP